MVAIPILLPLVKPFRASWSGKPFFRAVPHCGQQGEKGKCEVRGLYGIPNLAQIAEGCRKVLSPKASAALDVSPVRSTFTRIKRVGPRSSNGFQDFPD